MQEELQQLLERIISNITVEHLDSRITNYTDYKNKYAIIKPRVIVKTELTNGKVFEIDVTDYFEGVIK